MYEYMEIGPVPAEEDCAQVGEDNFRLKAQSEMNAYIGLLERTFPNAVHSNVTFKAKWFPHDFGSYGEVCIYWDDEDEESTKVAFEIESNLPSEWDRMALQELNIEKD